MLQQLKKKNFINEELDEILDKIAGPNKAIFERQFFKVKGKKISKQYSPEIRSFALTLNFLSPKAYEYVRDTFNTCLPHSRTIRKWYQSLNCMPGFTTESFEAIKGAVDNANEENKRIVLHVIFDEIHIRQHIDWDGHGEKAIGFVDVGDGGNSSTLASQILVFLAVCVNKAWKIPLAFFPIASINAEQKRNIAVLCLQNLLTTGAEVTGITFDGAATNLTVAKLLGCDIRNINSPRYFKIENCEQKYILHPDPVHMLKLVRNALHDLKIIKDGEGNQIKWEFLKNLMEIQEKEGLHLGNKLRKAHIYFSDQKMRVKLAVQLFSRSVADAIDFCREILNMKEFENSEATANFVRIFNDSFDVLNSRKVSEYDYKKRALCKNNFPHVEPFTIEAIDYISKLVLISDTPIIKSARNVGFIGFIRGLQNIAELYERFILTEKLSFLPLYKITQDHIELFFSSIRMGLGSNNNPSVKQFIGRYKKLLLRSQIREGGVGNCLPLEKMHLLPVNPIDPLAQINQTANRSQMLQEEESADISPSVNINDSIPELHFLHDHSYAEDPARLSFYIESVVEYIAGYAVFSINKKLHCCECLAALIGDSAPNTLIAYKSRGYLKNPSESVRKICLEIEKEMRRRIKLSTSLNNMLTKTEYSALKISIQKSFIGKKFFENQESHMIEGEHYALLLKLITETYLKVRYHFIAKNISEKNSLRQKFNRLVLFQGM